MESHKILSESEEMYLVTTALLLESGEHSPVPISHLSDQMDVLPVSVNQMVRKLENSGYLVYKPYKGVALTPTGRQHVNQVLRRRRLWEVFFVENLQLSSQFADELACRLEHIIPSEVAERLAAHLNQPKVSPSGAQIPSRDDEEPSSTACALTELGVGAQATLISCCADQATRSFLNNASLKRGNQITVMAIDSRGDYLIKTEQDERLHLIHEIAQCILVDHLPESVPFTEPTPNPS